MGSKRESRLREIRKSIDELNERILVLLNERAEFVEELGPVKGKHGLAPYDPVREAEQLQRLMLENRGPMSNTMVEQVFRAIFRSALSLQMEAAVSKAELVTSRSGQNVVDVGGVEIGGGKPVLIAGPCAVEQEDVLDEVAGQLAELGVKLMRGGAFKPRTSPYTFQGLGLAGVEMLVRVAARHGLKVVSELTDTELLEPFAAQVDMVQVGQHNMFNYDLLKKLGQHDSPVLLKRNFSARIEEFFLAAEYLVGRGNRNVVLCERGIRTFETATRNTLDISSVCIIKELTDLPVIVDVSHAAGRKDLLLPLARASLAAGADGIMVEVHARPDAALSDGGQQMDMEQFKRFIGGLEKFLV